MGGFTFVVPDLKNADPKDQNCQVGSFKELIRNPEFEVPSISVAQIQDRSKGDALSKLIAIVQTKWFVMQCVARSRQRLALTELETHHTRSCQSECGDFRPLVVQATRNARTCNYLLENRSIDDRTFRSTGKLFRSIWLCAHLLTIL